MKPKFEVGDIIFTNDIDECKIIRVLEDAYEITNDEIENDANQVSWIIKFEDQDNWTLKTSIGIKFKEGDIIRNIETKEIGTVVSVDTKYYCFRPGGFERIKNPYEWEVIGHVKMASKIEVGDRIRPKGTDFEGSVIKRIYQERGSDWVEFEDDSSDCKLDYNFFNNFEKVVENTKSDFDKHIQEGDKVVYNEDIGCRVNLSQLARISKKECDEIVDKCVNGKEPELVDTDDLPFSIKPINAELEKEVDKFLSKEFDGVEEDELIYCNIKRDVTDIANHFANWQKEQIMKDAVDGEILEVPDDYNSLYEYTHLELGFDGELLKEKYKNGDKVKLLIIKKETN